MPDLITFSGIDGAGKTTLLLRLRDHFQILGVPVHTLSFWDDVAILSRLREKTSHTVFKGDPGIGSPDRPVERRDKNVQAWYLTVARLFLYWLDALHLCWLVQSRGGPTDVLMFDRYIYDELANLPLERLAVRAYVRFVLFFVPRPDRAYVLDADPVEARGRKPEYPLEFLFRNRQAYLDLAKMAGLTVIPVGDTALVLRDAFHLVPLRACV